MDLSFLKTLGIESENSGTSTGLEWMNSDHFLESHSPVDGQLIGRTGITTEAVSYTHLTLPTILRV